MMMGMILLIGNKRKNFSLMQKIGQEYALTFFEVMVSVVILSMGLVMIYKSFLASLDYQRYLSHRLYAMNFLDSRIEAIRSDYRILQYEFPQQDSENFAVIINNKRIPFRLDMMSSGIANLEKILKVDLLLSWEERGRTFRLSRSFYMTRF